jgi:transposase-like protein
MASNTQKTDNRPPLPSVETIQRELGSAESIDDFFGREGIFARLFAKTLEEMLEAELTAHLGYEKHASEGRNSGHSRNGKRSKKLRTQTGDVDIQVPRDRNSEYQSPLLEQHAASNTLEEKIINLYSKGISTRDIQDTMQDLYGIDVSAATISTITDKVWSLVEEWQNRPLERSYPIIYLDGVYVKLRQDGKVENCAVYVVLGIDLEGHRDILGQWLSEGTEGANFWLSVLSDLQARGVEDVFIACVDGLKGFKEAIQSVFPQSAVQRCLVHQIRNSLKYVTWEDRKAVAKDLKKIYRAPTREEAETHLLQLSEIWGEKYAMAVRSWENNWEDLATMFDYPAEIRRLIYTTNAIEGYNRQLRKVTKNKAAFPSAKAVRKLLFLANRNITAKWTMPVQKWAKILNQLAIRFEGRFTF